MTIGRADILAAIRRATPATPPTDHKPCCACCSEVDRLTAEVVVEVQEVADTIPIACRAAVKNERARIAEAVNRIPPGEFVRAAVLSIVEGADRLADAGGDWVFGYDRGAADERLRIAVHVENLQSYPILKVENEIRLAVDRASVIRIIDREA